MTAPVGRRLRAPVATLALRPHPYAGVLATFDGVDGSGKSTSVRILKQIVEASGAVAREVKLPSTAAQQLPYLRQFAYDHRAAEDGRVDAVALFITLLGDRLITVRACILPLLQQGYWVICDRYVYLTFAQIAAFGASPAELATLVAIANLFPRPDLPCVTHVPAEEAIRRIRARPPQRDATAKIDVGIMERVGEGVRAVCEVNQLNLIPTWDDAETARILGQKAALLLGRRAGAVATAAAGKERSCRSSK